MQNQHIHKNIDPRLATASVLVTSGIHAKMSANKKFQQEVLLALVKFEVLDWGDTCRSDAKANALCLETHDRLFAVYNTSEGRIYIIADATMADKPYQTITVLFPIEY